MPDNAGGGAASGFQDHSAFEKRLQIFQTTRQAHRENEEQLASALQLLLDENRHLKELLTQQPSSENAKDVQTQAAVNFSVEPQVSSGKGLASYVAVLVDGNDYHFRKHLVEARFPGGVRAAEQLHASIGSELSDLNVTNRDVVAFANADVANLPIMLQDDVDYHDSESTIDFVAGFNNAFDSFNVVDCGSDKKTTIAKLRRMFRIFMADPNCKHVFAAVCHSTDYLPMLESAGREATN